METNLLLDKKIRNIPDFPKPGIIFKDITPLLNDAESFKLVIDCFAKRYAKANITQVVGIESRGFIFGSALAHTLGSGFSVVRKPGKLPYKTEREEYQLEYGTDSLEIHTDAVNSKDNVLIVDDLLATGGTAGAAARLVHRLGATVHELAFVIELGFLEGRSKLNLPVYSILKY